MTATLIITILIIVIGVYLFVKDVFTIDTTSILIMALFIVTGVLAPEEGFAGFNHPATLTLGCMFVLSAAVFKTGILDRVSELIVKAGKINYYFALVIFTLLASFLSAFINDTAVVALLMPMVLEVARKTKKAPSKMLIPLSYAALFGGTCTLIGTSTNILVSSYALKYDAQPFRMFDFSIPALILSGIGILYMLTVGQWLLPSRSQPEEAAGHPVVDDYFTTIHLQEGHKDIDQPLKKTKLTNEYGVAIREVERAGRRIAWFPEEFTLQAGDVIRITVTPQGLGKLLNDELIWVDSYTISGTFEEEEEKQIFETMIPAGSDLAGRTLSQLNFRKKYAGSVLAVRHREEVAWRKIQDLPFREGDMLLLLSSAETMQKLAEERYLFTLTKHDRKKVNYKKAIPALLIAAAVILTAALGVTSILIAGMIGSVLMITTRLLKPEEAYNAIEWKVIFMVAGVLSMGTALEKTGGAAMIASLTEQTLGQYNPTITLSIVYLICWMGTNILSSKATAALMTPIVINIAHALHISERPFLVAVMFACSLTFMTPMSYPTNTMVYAPGNYRFKDYLVVGTPLNIILWLVASWLIPQFFPFS